MWRRFCSFALEFAALSISCLVWKWLVCVFSFTHSCTIYSTKDLFPHKILCQRPLCHSWLAECMNKCVKIKLCLQSLFSLEKRSAGIISSFRFSSAGAKNNPHSGPPNDWKIRATSIPVVFVYFKLCHQSFQAGCQNRKAHRLLINVWLSASVNCRWFILHSCNWSRRVRAKHVRGCVRWDEGWI